MSTKSKSMRAPVLMWEAWAAVFASLIFSFVEPAYAAPIEVDLGPSHTVTSQTPVSSFDALNGTTLDGQSVSIDFSFANSEFVRIFTATSWDFLATVKLQTNDLGFVGFLEGTGYLIDAQGNPIPGYGVTGSASGSDGWMAISLFPLLKDEDGTPNTDLLRPFDFFGIHYDLMFPEVNDPSIHVTNGDFWLSDPSGGVFGIGPGVPENIVPESGNTLLLLGIAAVLFIGLRFRRV